MVTEIDADLYTKLEDGLEKLFDQAVRLGTANNGLSKDKAAFVNAGANAAKAILELRAKYAAKI